MRSSGSFRRLVFHGLVLTDTTEIGTAILPLRHPPRFRRLAASLLVAMAARRVPRAPIPVAFALAVLAVLATVAPQQAAAQTVTTFISNTGQNLTGNSNAIRATAFTTGTGTYTLSSVAIKLTTQNAGSPTPVVQIYGDTGGNPGTLMATMTNPAAVVDNTLNIYTAPANTTLAGGTTYWLVTSNSASTEGQGFRLPVRSDTNLDIGTAAGWSIGNALFRLAPANPWGSSSNRIQFQIRGTVETPATPVNNPPPTLTSATVTANGTGINLVFSETMLRLSASLPQVSDFTVTADGIAVTVSRIDVHPNQVNVFIISLDVRIRQGQVVVITYTDPTMGDDTRAAQNLAGNDVATFTTGVDSVPAVTNNSTLAAVAPDAPTALTATASGTTTINLSWTAPVDNGGSVITGYKIEISSDSGTTWPDQVANTASTTTYEHTGLAASTTRHYRVSAINSIGASTPSDVVNTTTGIPANNAPTVANAIPNQTATAGTAFSYQFPTNTFNDTDTGDTLSYAATKADDTTLPTWLSFTDSTRTFAGMPAAADTGTVSVKVTASDGNSGTVSDEFDITVRDPNAGICARTEAVRDALLASIAGVTDCANVTDTHLAAITDTLNLDSKSISALAAGDFDGLTALTGLDLSDNSLTALPAGVFDGLTALTALDLSNNSTALPAGVFDELTALTTLDLAFNSLTELPAGIFDELTALTALDLQANSLTALPAGIFDELTALTLLNLAGNSLTALTAGVFEPLTALTYLALSTNPGALFSPTAVALPDDGTVPAAGGTVMLDGSGSGGAWGTNLTYSWALTTPATGVTVTFDNDASAKPTVTIPQVTAGTDLVFTLTVTGRAGDSDPGISTSTDTAKVTVNATEPGAPTGLTATASGTTRIDLSWTAPASTGGSAITGYNIEVSPNGTSNWTDRVADLTP